MKKKLLILGLVLSSNLLLSQHKFQKDFDYFWEFMNVEYAYFDVKQTDWKKVKELYSRRLQDLKEDWEFTYLIELMKHELYDPHVSLNRNVDFSYRLIPNDLDAYISVKNDKYFVSDIREGHTISNYNIKIGDEILAINNDGIRDVIKWNLPASIKSPNNEVKEYFGNLIFAGRHNKPRKIKLLRNKKEIVVDLPKPSSKENWNTLLDVKILQNNIGYIKINNSLGNNNVIKLFQKSVDELSGTRAIIIDLRETHSGGNAEVAKSIMGKFITNEMPYQVHERVGLEREFGIKRKYIEILTPLKNPYTKPVYILISRWTGSVGEAIAQGFSNIKTTTVVGTDMAKLKGAINCRRLPVSGINVCYPFEKLFNIDGTPREKFIPEVYTKNYSETYKKVLELINEQRR